MHTRLLFAFLAGSLLPMLHSQANVSADVVLDDVIVNPPWLSLAGIITEVRITRENINGTDVQHTIEFTTNGEFNAISGGFFASSDDPFIGISDAAFVRALIDNGSSDSAFLLGAPTAVSVGATDAPIELSVDAASYSSSFAAGNHELATLTFAKMGSFEIRGSDQQPDSLIFLNEAGTIVGSIRGSVSAVPEPSALLLVSVNLLLLMARCRRNCRCRQPPAQIRT